MKMTVKQEVLRDLSGIAFALFIIAYLIFGPPEFQPPTLYECPCEVSEVVKDVIRHTNKEGTSSVTTFVDIKDCLIVMPTK
jgi:hypothetical protein